MSEKRVFLVDGKRTPFGKFGGSLSLITPVDLSVHASKPIVEGLEDKIDHVILGNVVPSSTDTMYGGRHLALKLGMPQKTPGYVVNRLCGSGIQIMLDAKRMIQLGEANSVLVSGVENMSMVPHLTYGARFGTKYGSLENVDMLLDALTDKYAQIPMGITAENLAKKHEISREQCDEFSLQSHIRTKKAYDDNLMQGEIVAIQEGRVDCSEDEHYRKDANIEGMNKLRPSFQKEGTVTPGTASGIVDGACSLLIASEEFCSQNKLTPLAEIVDGAVVGVDPCYMGIGPVDVSRMLLNKTGISQDEIDLWEINEAFAAQTLACQKELGIDSEKLNIWGGSIAIGHPLAASGSRISLTLARQLKHHNKKLGIATACIGGGQGIAVLLKSV